MFNVWYKPAMIQATTYTICVLHAYKEKVPTYKCLLCFSHLQTCSQTSWAYGCSVGRPNKDHSWVYPQQYMVRVCASSNKMLCMLQQRFLQLHKKPYKNAKLSKIKNNLIEAVFNTLLPFYFDWMGVSLYHHVCNLEYALVVIWRFLQHNFVETLWHFW